MNKADFLIELWAEDLPVPVQDEASSKLEQAFAGFFKSSGVPFSSSRHFSTPRRAAALFTGVEKYSTPERNTVKGPPAAVAFGKDSAPTAALEGFVRKMEADLADVRVKDTEKGRYVFIEKVTPRRSTEQLIREKAAEIIYSVKFDATMRWNGFSFPRPVRRLLVMYGKKSLRVECFGLKSSRASRGFDDEKIAVPSPAGYETAMKRKKILVDPARRRKELLKQLSSCVRKPYSVETGKLQDLIDYTVGTCEYPTAISSQFDSRFLSIPREFLEETLEFHQKCFPVTGKDGALSARFVFVVDGDSAWASSMRPNFRRCVEARFEDTAFFWSEDMRKPLAEYYGALESVNYVGKFKNLKEKAERVAFDAVRLCREWAPSAQKSVAEISALIYCDIATKIVAEFPGMHGIAGQHLAERDGISSDGTLRWAVTLEKITDASAVCALAERLNTLKSFFHAGLEPTASKDPYGLKKAADGVIEAAARSKLRFDLRRVFSVVFDDTSAQVREKVLQFLKGRMAAYLEKEGISGDVPAMVIEKFATPRDCMLAASAVIEYRGKSPAEFDGIVLLAKRAGNILRQASEKNIKFSGVRTALLREVCEKELFNAVGTVRMKVLELIGEGDYRRAMKELVRLKKPLDTFFDKIMVMAKEEEIRDNRLSLIDEAAGLFSVFGKFANIARRTDKQ